MTIPDTRKKTKESAVFETVKPENSKMPAETVKPKKSMMQKATYAISIIIGYVIFRSIGGIAGLIVAVILVPGIGMLLGAIVKAGKRTKEHDKE